MACFRCRMTGEIICDPEEAELRCEVCGCCLKVEDKDEDDSEDN
mgnify:CR=1 FL=1